jgi:hypothetical protein
MNLATPAPEVEEAIADAAVHSHSSYRAEPARPSDDTTAEPTKPVEPAVPYDDPKKFAPQFTKEQMNHLSVAALRGGAGSDFESKAAVLRGAPTKNILQILLPCIYDERDFVAMGEVTRYVFIKGNCIFVYGQDTDPSPLYAIPLETVRAIQEDPKKPDKHSVTISPRVNTNEARQNLVTILLKYRNSGKQAYQFTFDTMSDKSVAKRFLDHVNFVAKTSATGEVVSASVLKADYIGKEAAKRQPDI